MYRTKITVSGLVQKVGLRAQIKTIADGIGVCGTVENMRDGSVLVVCEAERAAIEEMVHQIRSGTKLAVIEDVLVKEGPPATGMVGFEIVRGDSTEEMLSAVTTGTQAVVGMLTTLNEMKQGQARLEKGQSQTNETLARLEKGQAETKDAIKSMDSKLDASLENDAQSLEILRDLRDGGLLRVP